MTERRERDSTRAPSSLAGPTRFIILAAPRTGSNLLCTLLNGHPEILCHHELLNPTGIFYALDLREGDFGVESIEERDRDPLGFVDRVLGRPLGHACLGWKMTRDQGEGVLDDILAQEATLKIVLRRRNRIRTLVSERISLLTGRWEMYGAEEVALEPTSVRITPSELEQHATLNDQFYDSILRALADAGQAHHALEYEDVLGADSQRRLLRFLGVSPIATRLSPASMRQNPWSLRRLISNFDELEVELRGSPFHDELVRSSRPRLHR